MQKCQRISAKLKIPSPSGIEEVREAGDVGADVSHPTICGHCTSNLFGTGEVRSIA